MEDNPSEDETHKYGVSASDISMHDNSKLTNNHDSRTFTKIMDLILNRVKKLEVDIRQTFKKENNRNQTEANPMSISFKN